MIFTWQVVGLDVLARLIVERCGSTRPGIVAVNGHSSSGKTTLAERLAATLPRAAVLHTDDLAWHQGVFAWDGLLRDAVLPVVRAGEPLDYRPPQWQARSRAGSITLPGSLDFLFVEGVGASQASVRDAYDVVDLGGDRGAHAPGAGPAAAGGRRDAVTGGVRRLDGRGERLHHP